MPSSRASSRVRREETRWPVTKFLIQLEPPRLREYSPGTRLQDDLGEEFYYVEADAAISVAAVVVIEIDHGASPITTTNGDLGLRVGRRKDGYC